MTTYLSELVCREGMLELVAVFRVAEMMHDKF